MASMTRWRVWSAALLVVAGGVLAVVAVAALGAACVVVTVCASSRAAALISRLWRKAQYPRTASAPMMIAVTITLRSMRAYHGGMPDTRNGFSFTGGGGGMTRRSRCALFSMRSSPAAA